LAVKAGTSKILLGLAQAIDQDVNIAFNIYGVNHYLVDGGWRFALVGFPDGLANQDSEWWMVKENS
jgi:hypothetical protein